MNGVGFASPRLEGLSYLTLVTALFTDDSVCFSLFPDGSAWFYYVLTTEMC